MNFDYDFYNLVLSEIVARIASDQLIIENELEKLVSGEKSQKLQDIIKRNRVNVLLLDDFVYIGRHFEDSPIGTNNLMDAIKIAETAFGGAKIKLHKNRTKPLINVIGDKKIISSLIKIVLAIVLLEDIKIKKINLSIRRRGDFVTLKIEGGNIINHDLFLKDSATLASNLINYYGAHIRFASIKQKRVVFVRLHLSNQMPLLYNK